MFGRSLNKDDDKRSAASDPDNGMKAVMTRNGLTLYKRSASPAMSKNPVLPDHSPDDAA